MKEIRKDAVRLYTGIGAMTSKDGIFSQEEKYGVNYSSGLSNDALDIYKRANMGDSQSVAGNRDSEMLQPDGEEERLEAS